jgi:PAS domain S-box-containing protein
MDVSQQERERDALQVELLSSAGLPVDATEHDVANAPFQSIVQSINDPAVVLLNAEGRITFWNAGAERLWGYRDTEVIDQPFALLFTVDAVDRNCPQLELKTARREGRAEHAHWHVHKGGGHFWGSGVTTPVQDRELLGYLCIIRDLTEQKLGQEKSLGHEAIQRDRIAELEAANQQRDKFLATISHEIRNPLAPILTALQVMQQHAAEENTIQQQTRGVIERQIRQLAHLVDDLLETSRFQAGKLQIRREPTDLRAVLERAAESAWPFIHDRGHELKLSIGREPIWLHGDPTRLEQVFLNLLHNAAKFTDCGGQISLTVRLSKDQVVVTVSDNGIGIPADMLQEIFKMFTQVDHSQQQSQEGLGIGLSLVKQLTEMHDGSISVRSDGPNLGSEFSVHLPISTERKSQNAIVDRDHINASGGLRILLADDNRDAAFTLSIILKGSGNEVRTASNGIEALELAETFQPDVVLMDIGMPKLNGYQTAQRMRQQPWGRSALLVAVTGWGQEEDKRRTEAAGFDHHLIKPIELSELRRLLATHPQSDRQTIVVAQR